MSLINDALKRAKQAQAALTSASSTATPDNAIDESGVAMRPADSHHGSVGLPVYFMPTLLFLICGACFFIVKGWDSRRQAGVYPEPVTVHAREPELTAAAPEMSEAQIHEAIPPNRQFALDETAAKPAAVEEPSFRLQGIFYEPKRVSALVNSTSVRVGDVVANARVKAITRTSVTLVVDGQTKVLTLE
jgi:hypothetical protein